MNSEQISSLIHTGNVWMPYAGSEAARQTDYLFNFILWFSYLFFAIVILTAVYFFFKYRHTSKNPYPTSHITHNTRLELLWSIIPLILVMIVFYWGFREYLNLSTPPEDAIEIYVSGRKWMWEFTYPNGLRSTSELVVPVDQSVKLIMSSEDVIHSFFLPNFRQKRDVLPNRYSVVWFKAEKSGNYQVFCTEYCGDGHSQMLATLRVVSYQDYKAFLSGSADEDTPLPQLGEQLYKTQGCSACHTIDGRPSVGPTWKGLYGRSALLKNGQAVKADDNYLRQSIVDPAGQVVQGYEAVMPTYKGKLTDRELNGLIDYIKTLK